jgi:hypothetical protein
MNCLSIIRPFFRLFYVLFTILYYFVLLCDVSVIGHLAVDSAR